MLKRLCYAQDMEKKDVNQTAFSVVQQATGDNAANADPPGESDQNQKTSSKNTAAIALGRLGGLKGGPARAKKLTDEQRREIASKAANARWRKK